MKFSTIIHLDLTFIWRWSCKHFSLLIIWECIIENLEEVTFACACLSWWYSERSSILTPEKNVSSLTYKWNDNTCLGNKYLERSDAMKGRLELIGDIWSDQRNWLGYSITRSTRPIWPTRPTRSTCPTPPTRPTWRIVIIQINYKLNHTLIYYLCIMF